MSDLQEEQLLQMQAMYQLTTDITRRCFEACIGRINASIEDCELNCVSNCAANSIRTKLLFSKRLIDASRKP